MQGELVLADTALEISGRGVLPVSRGAAALGVLLAHAPLASAADLSLLEGSGVESVYPRLWELHREGYVERGMLGWTRGRVARWWLTEKGLEGMGVLGATWHDEWGRCNLLDRLPMVEWFYRAASLVKGYGRLRAFQWLNGMSIDAAVRYETGWVGMYWSGLWQGEVVIRKRLERLGNELVRHGMLDSAVWPGVLCFVVNDQWERELVYRAARKVGLVEYIGVLCLADETKEGLWEGGPSRGFIYQPFDGKDVGGWPFESRLGSGPWGESGGVVAGRVLDCVGEWPGMGLKMAKSLLEEGPGGRRAGRVLKDLVGWELIESQLGEGRARYSVSSRGVDVLRRRDRMGYVFTNDKSEAWSWLRRPRLRSHEEGLMEIMGAFLGVGLPVAAGWRSWEPLGGGGGIAPDGMVYLHHGPFGEGWHYLEYERTAKGEKRVLRKLRGYGSKKRQDRWPLLVVARDERAEEVFNRVGGERSVLMVTSTLGRVEQFGVLGNLDCWKVYGQPVLIG